MDKLNVADIIKNAYENKPKGVEDAFNDVIQQKMADAIEARRQEIAASMYGNNDTGEDAGEETESPEE